MTKFQQAMDERLTEFKEHYQFLAAKNSQKQWQNPIPWPLPPSPSLDAPPAHGEAAAQSLYPPQEH